MSSKVSKTSITEMLPKTLAAFLVECFFVKAY